MEKERKNDIHNKHMKHDIQKEETYKYLTNLKKTRNNRIKEIT